MRETIEALVARVNRNAFIAPMETETMAKKFVLESGKTFTPKAGKKFGGERKYPWPEWFNGDLILLERSSGPENDKGTIEVPTTERDFGVPVTAMFPKIKTAARAAYKVATVSRYDPNTGQKMEDAIVLQARDMTEEERAEEDDLRQFEKDQYKAYIAACNAGTASKAKGGRKEFNLAYQAKLKAGANGTPAPAPTPAPPVAPPKPTANAGKGGKK